MWVAQLIAVLGLDFVIHAAYWDWQREGFQPLKIYRKDDLS